ncbi:MAG: rod shape-determining protein MreD [Armatimonadota bacterium]
MMRYLLLILTFFILSLMQATFFTTPVRPDFILIMVICISIYEPPERALFLSFTAGLIEGLFFTDIWGIYLISLSIISFLIILFKKRIFYENIPLLFPVTSGIIFTIVNELIFYVFSFLYPNIQFYIFEDIIYRLILNTVIIIPFCYLYDYLFSREDKLKFYNRF